MPDMVEQSDTPHQSEPAFFEIRFARMEDIHPILHLHREAFADKFGVAFGAKGTDRGVEAMAEAWRKQGLSALRGMLVAVSEGQIIGTTSLRTWEMGGDMSGAAEIVFHRMLGTWGALRSIFTLSLLDHSIDRFEGYITDVAVLQQYRRRGIARALLMRARDEAQQRNKRFLGLYVSASNGGALRLYQQLGFAKSRIRRSIFAGLLLHQRSWIYMRKELG
jgi:ribosomal protein S18 acetylase RimI-like enzyme